MSTTVHLLDAGYAGKRVASSVTLVRDGDALPMALLANAEMVGFWARYRADGWLDHDGDGHPLAPNGGLWPTPGHTEEAASLIARADDGVFSLTHLWWRGDRPPEVDPLAGTSRSSGRAAAGSSTAASRS